MSRVLCHRSPSLDGCSAGPGQTLQDPIGTGSARLHQCTPPVGAVVMGRNTFGPVRGAWPDETWRGWWGGGPPHRAPVLTHHARPAVETTGTTFRFVTEGFDVAPFLLGAGSGCSTGPSTRA